MREFSAASTSETIRHLDHMLSMCEKVYFIRLGDGDFRLMKNKDDGRHKASPELMKELKECFLIRDNRFIKSAPLGYPKEPGIRGRVFEIGTGRQNFFDRVTRKLTTEKHFYNPIAFHYASIFKPKLLKDLVNKHIKSKVKMFVGSNNKEAMEAFYGPIDYYINTPSRSAYSFIDEWYPKIKKDVEKCEVILPSVGAASSIVAKRLWNDGVNIHCIDIGSLNDVLEDKNTRGWINKIGLEKIKKNLVG